jgi:hypothetical protein
LDLDCLPKTHVFKAWAPITALLSQSQAWCYTPEIPAFKRLRQEDDEFMVSLGYT